MHCPKNNCQSSNIVLPFALCRHFVTPFSSIGSTNESAFKCNVVKNVDTNGNGKDKTR